MEEFRPWLADRVALSLINRKQLRQNHFERAQNGAVLLNDEGRKTLLTTYQTRKQDEVMHPYLKEKVTIGTLFSYKPCCSPDTSGETSARTPPTSLGNVDDDGAD